MAKMKILCYNVTDDAFASIKKLASRFGAQTLAISPENYGLPIAVAASGTAAMSNPLVVPSLPEPMLVFVSFPQALLSVFIDAMRERKITVSLKAMLTPHNAAWDAHKLYNELYDERRAFAAASKKNPG